MASINAPASYLGHLLADLEQVRLWTQSRCVEVTVEPVLDLAREQMMKTITGQDDSLPAALFVPGEGIASFAQLRSPLEVLSVRRGR